MKSSICFYGINEISEPSVSRIDDYSDSKCNKSSPDLHSNGLNNDMQRDNMTNQGRGHERIRTDKKVLEMNNQIRKLTTLVRVLAEQVSTNKTNSELHLGEPKHVE